MDAYLIVHMDVSYPWFYISTTRAITLVSVYHVTVCTLEAFRDLFIKGNGDMEMQHESLWQQKPCPRFPSRGTVSFFCAVGHMWATIVDFDRILFIPELCNYVSKSCHLFWIVKFYICGPCNLSLSTGKESFDSELRYPYAKTVFALSCQGRLKLNSIVLL